MTRPSGDPRDAGTSGNGPPGSRAQRRSTGSRRTRSQRESTAPNPLAAINLGRLRETRWQDLAIRFVFGATVSVVAGVIGVTLGARVGGMFLAFPAILPATLTLIAKEEGEQRSFHDLQGTVAGACGLAGFGVVASISIGRLDVLLALGLSFVAWCVVAGTLYLVWATWLRRHGVAL